MTIGIASFGKDCVTAAREAVLGAEAACHGSIGGFAVIAFLDETGAMLRAATQRGGVAAIALPEGWRDARAAAIISSGPDRPEPLAQFLPGLDGVGLITGHRLPNAPGADGVALNRAALDRLAAGATPRQAVERVLAATPEADAGLIAVSADGEIGWANAARVLRRSDLGIAAGRTLEGGYALMLNSIHGDFPSASALAAALGDVAARAAPGSPGRHALLSLSRPLRATPAARDRVHIDATGEILAIETANPAPPQSAFARRTAVYLGAEVLHDDRVIGLCVSEAFAAFDAGLVIPAPGEAARRILMRGL